LFGVQGANSCVIQAGICVEGYIVTKLSEGADEFFRTLSHIAGSHNPEGRGKGVVTLFDICIGIVPNQLICFVGLSGGIIKAESLGYMIFIRTILGKYTLETMIPVLICVMIYFNMAGLTAVLVLVAIALLQIILIAATKTNSLIHDLLAKTVVVDFASQRIFGSEQELLEYKKKLHAERAARQEH